jgi:PKD domain
MRLSPFAAALLVLSLVVVAPSAAAAATANFQGDCSYSGSNLVCSFDALRPTTAPSSCPNSFIWKYSWDYGDGSSSGLTGTNPVSHTYTAPLAGAYTVTLTVICWDGNMPNITRPVCISFGVPGCIAVGAGYN